jgi:hypothetical protein
MNTKMMLECVEEATLSEQDMGITYCIFRTAPHPFMEPRRRTPTGP